MTQPSLTRAIKQLEAELGGDLFRRERPAAQLTELGQRMHPLLKQCYEAATGARSLASSFKSGEVGALRIALTHSVDLSLLIPHLDQIKRLFNRLEFRFLRGSSREVGEFLKNGEAELGIAAEIGEDWDRLDSWPLFTEGFQLVVNKRRPLAGRGDIGVRGPANRAVAVAKLLRTCGPAERVASRPRHRRRSQPRNFVGARPDRTARSRYRRCRCAAHRFDPGNPEAAAVDGLDARRTVHLYGVAGRERTAVASAVML